MSNGTTDRGECARLLRTSSAKLLATREAKAFEAWIELQVEADEQVREKERVRERSRPPSKFFADMNEARPVIEDAMAFIERADDAALAKVVFAAEPRWKKVRKGAS